MSLPLINKQFMKQGLAITIATMKMNVTDTVKQACGHWPRILPALGVKVIKNRHQSCPVCGGSGELDAIITVDWKPSSK